MNPAAAVMCAGVALLGFASSPQAQQLARPSQLASISQTIAETKLDIRYRRPVARGRELFGALVPWDRVWSPSSDTAAVFTASGPISVNGDTLRAGTYSLWAIPGPKEWTIIFSSASPTFHLRYPPANDALRVRATPRTGEHMETLAFYFPVVDGDSAQLVLQWGRTVVPLNVHALRP